MNFPSGVAIDLDKTDMCEACKQNLPIIAHHAPSEIVPLVILESISGHCLQELLKAVFPVAPDAPNPFN